jgi:hypothetical protein
MHSCYKYLLSTYCVLGTVVSTGDMAENKRSSLSSNREVRKQTNEQFPVVINSRKKNHWVTWQRRWFRMSEKGLFAKVTSELSQVWTDQGLGVPG